MIITLTVVNLADRVVLVAYIDESAIPETPPTARSAAFATGACSWTPTTGRPRSGGFALRLRSGSAGGYARQLCAAPVVVAGLVTAARCFLEGMMDATGKPAVM